MQPHTLPPRGDVDDDDNDDDGDDHDDHDDHVDHYDVNVGDGDDVDVNGQ